VDLPHGHPTTMSLFDQMLIHKFTKVGAPCVEAKFFFGTFIKNPTPWFQTCLTWHNIIRQHKHILQYHIIRGDCHLGRYNWTQVKHSYNMNLLTKHR
jgi:hypothetical protein